MADSAAPFNMESIFGREYCYSPVWLVVLLASLDDLEYSVLQVF